MATKTVGVDLAKNVFQLHGVDESGNVFLRKRIKWVGTHRDYDKIDVAKVRYGDQ